MISAPVTALRERAGQILARLPAGSIVASESTVGGGALPGATLPSVALALDPAHPADLAERLRRGDPPLVARINAGRVLVDLRSVLPEEDAAVVRALLDALGQPD
jgi:L-seryl-tRNA(Ser) seleniumtransferase